MEAILESGLILHTDYSGKGTAEQAHRLLGFEMKKQGLTLDDFWFVAWHANDVAPQCQRILLADEEGAKHVFSGFAGMLPPGDREMMNSLRASVVSPPAVRERGYLKQREYLRKHGARLFGPHALAGNCLRHPDAQCPMQWVDPEGTPQHCRPLKHNFSGPVCLGWTRMSQSREKLAHPSTEAFYTWLEMMVHSDFDLVTMENAEDFDPMAFVEPMERDRQHLVVGCCFGLQARIGITTTHHP